MGLQIRNKRFCSSPNRSVTGLDLPTCRQEIFPHRFFLSVAPIFCSSYIHYERRKHAGRAKALIHAWTKPKAAPWGWARFIYDPFANPPPREKHTIRANWGPIEVSGLWSRPLIPAITAHPWLPYIQPGASETSHPTVAKASDSRLNWALIWLLSAKGFRISNEK